MTFKFRQNNVAQISLSRVDGGHGDVHAAYVAMGSPKYPTPAQIQVLKTAAELGKPEIVPVKDGSVSIRIPPHGLAILEVSGHE